MATQVQWRGGSTAEHATFTGAAREVTVDTQKKTLVVHDGSTAGGEPLLREDGSNSALALGSEAAPALKFTGDTNTGIYSPGADQVAISTNGTGKLFVNSDGSTWFGNPAATRFQIAATTGMGDSVYSYSSNYYIWGLRNESNALAIDSGFDGNIIFRAENKGVNSSPGSAKERMRITSTGELKHLGGGTEGSPAVYFAGSAPSNSLYVQATTGKVGLGTSSPGANLSVVGDISVSNATTPLKIVNSSEPSSVTDFTAVTACQIERSGISGITESMVLRPVLYRYANVSSHSKTGLGVDLREVGTTYNRVISLQADGKVGVGTTSPGETLTLNTDSGPTSIRFGVTDANDFLIKNEGTNNLKISSPTTDFVTIDSSGRLLVGTSSTLGNNATLQTSGQQVNYQAFHHQTAQAGPFVILSKSNGTQASPTVVANNDYLGIIGFSGYDGTDYATRGAEIACQVDGAPGNDDMPGRLVFSTTADGASSPTPRATIDSSGRLLVGTPTSLYANALLQIYKASGTTTVSLESGSLADTQDTTYNVSSGSRSAGLGLYKHSGITNPGPYLSLQEEDGGTAFYWTDNSGNFRISSSVNHIGTTSGTVVGTQTSDARLKSNIAPLPYGVNSLKAIEPVTFTFNSEPNVQRIGFIAQQVQPLIPEAVYDTNEAIDGQPEDAPTKLAMDYSSLLPVLVKALQEAVAKIESLEARVAALEAN